MNDEKMWNAIKRGSIEEINKHLADERRKFLREHIIEDFTSERGESADHGLSASDRNPSMVGRRW